MPPPKHSLTTKLLCGQVGLGGMGRKDGGGAAGAPGDGGVGGLAITLPSTNAKSVCVEEGGGGASEWRAS